MTNPEQIIVPGAAQAQQQGPASGQTMVSIYDGHVVLHFPVATEHAVYAPLGAISDAAKMILMAVQADKTQAAMALRIVEHIADEVYEIRGDLKPAGGAMKHEIIERHRRTLTRRLEVVLNSQREKKTKSNHKLAVDLVNICLHAVFS